ncbi:MAG: murein biosynthesis integral membrane protein MurJ [Phycisphaerales bacterium]
MPRIDAQPTQPPPDLPRASNVTGAAPAPHVPLSSAFRAVFSVTLLSRIGGLARDVIIARVFQDSAINSAFQFAFAIPNMFRRLFGEGALSAAFLPEYTAQLKADPDAAHRLASLMLAALGLFTGIATLLGELLLLALLLLLPPNPERELSIRLTMVMLPFMPLICTVAILSGMLQVHGRFAASASGPLVLNAFIIGVGLWALATGRILDQRVAYTFAIATTLSGATQAFWFARLLRPHARWTRHCAAALPAARTVFRRFMPVLVGLGALQLGALLDQLIAMWPIWVGPTILGVAYPLDDASVAILAASQRLYQFPLGVFGIAVATAVFPTLSRHAADPAAFVDTLRRGIRLSLLLALPASLGLVLVSTDLTHVLYAADPARNVPGFSADGVARAAAVLAGYAPAIWAFTLNHVLARGFYAHADTITPMRIALVLVLINLAGNLLLIWPLREAGLAWSSALSGTLQTACLYFFLRRLPGGAAFDRATTFAVVRLVAAALVMAAGVATLLGLFPAPASWSAHLLRLILSCLLGSALFISVCLALGAPEIAWILRPARAERR